MTTLDHVPLTPEDLEAYEIETLRYNQLHIWKALHLINETRILHQKLAACKAYINGNITRNELDKVSNSDLSTSS